MPGEKVLTGFTFNLHSLNCNTHPGARRFFAVACTSIFFHSCGAQLQSLKCPATAPIRKVPEQKAFTLSLQITYCIKCRSMPFPAQLYGASYIFSLFEVSIYILVTKLRMFSSWSDRRGSGRKRRCWN